MISKSGLYAVENDPSWFDNFMQIQKFTQKGLEFLPSKMGFSAGLQTFLTYFFQLTLFYAKCVRVKVY